MKDAKKLTLRKSTLKNLSIKTKIRAGLGGNQSRQGNCITGGMTTTQQSVGPYSYCGCP
jgi:hypothetical protein